jgi:hypothetical protein
LLPNLTVSEIKVFLYIVRRTLGFKRREDTVSLGQICQGITTKDGRRLDRGTGLTRQGAQKAISGLIARSMIDRVLQTDPHNGSMPSLYRIRFSERADAPTATRSQPGSTDPGQQALAPPANRSALPLPTPVGTQETEIQETVESGSDAEREAVVRTIEGFGLGTPDDTIIRRVFKAGNGASGFQIASYLYDRLRFIQRYPQHAPKSMGWFPQVVTGRFRSGDKLERVHRTCL